MQKTDFHVLELFSEQVMLELSQIASLELLRTLMLCLVQLAMKRMQGHDAEKLLSQWEKVANAILRVKLKYMKGCFFLMKLMLFAMQKTDFHVLELFLQSKSC